MIFDSLENDAHYIKLSNNFAAAFKFLRENDLTSLPVGRMELDGSNMYVVV